MRRTLAAGLAALTFGGAIAAAAIPATAEARDWRGYHGDYGHHGHHDNGAAIVAGIAGLAIGAALADSGHHHTYYRSGYYNYGYAPGYYGYAPGNYGYAPGYYDYGYRPYATCESRRWVWDPYIGRRVLITSHYAC